MVVTAMMLCAPVLCIVGLVFFLWDKPRGSDAGMAIVPTMFLGILSAFVCSVVGTVLSILALHRSRRSRISIEVCLFLDGAVFVTIVAFAVAMSAWRWF